MNRMKPVVSVIIVNFRGEKYLTACLTSLFKERGEYEVLVVDSASPDKSVELLKRKYVKRQDFKLIELEKNWGPAKARNIGARAARGKYLFFLCYDTTVRAGWYRKVIDFFTRHPGVSCFQPKLIRRGTHTFDYAGDFLTPFGFLRERAQGAADRGQFDFETPIFSLKIAGMGIKARDFWSIKGFDEEMEYMWEETDFTWRLWLAGRQVYFNPHLTVYHAYVTKDKNTDYYREANVTYKGARNNIMSILKNTDSSSAVMMLSLNILSYAVLSLMFLFKLDFHRASAIWKGIAWNAFHFMSTLRRRDEIQRKRVLREGDIMELVGTQNDAHYYIRKAWAYVTGKPF